MATSAYHHGNLREALATAAVETVREHGHDALTVRELARRVGVSHNAAYRHFEHREDLLAEVADRAMDLLLDIMTRRVSLVRTRHRVLRARRRLAETGRGYVEFAVTEPGLFRLTSAASQKTTARLLRQEGPFVLLTTALDELVTVGFLAPDARPRAEIACWSAIHGFSVLHVDGPLREADTDLRDTLLEGVLETIDRSFAATTGTPVLPGELASPRRARRAAPTPPPSCR